MKNRDVVSGFYLPIHVEVGPSMVLKRAMLLVHCLVGVPLYSSGLSLWSCCLLLLLAGLHYIHLYLYRLNQRYVLILRGHDDWLLATGNAAPARAMLLPGSYVQPYLAVLTFRQGAAKTSVILLHDNVDPELFRRLRVLLRFPPR